MRTNSVFQLQEDITRRDDWRYRPYVIASWGKIMSDLDLGRVVTSIERLREKLPPPQVPTAPMVPFSAPMYFPIREYETLKDDIDIVCETLQRVDFSPSLLTKARRVQEIIYTQPERQEEDKLLRRNPQMATVWPKGQAAMIFQIGAITSWRDDIIKLKETFVEELSNRFVMVLPSSKTGYFDGSSNTFPSNVRNAFPSADYDMTEGNKCFALGRYTAAVFYLMRTLEVGLNVMGTSLDLTIAPNWHQAITKIQDEIESRSYATHPDWRNDEPFYSEAAAHFRLVKNAWRNHTMHTKERYDEERAQDIFNGVSAFMRHLATKLSEEE